MSQILLLNRLKPTNDSVATADSVKWDESKHPRKGGKFAKKGTGTTGKTGGTTGGAEKNRASWVASMKKAGHSDAHIASVEKYHKFADKIGKSLGGGKEKYSGRIYVPKAKEKELLAAAKKSGIALSKVSGTSGESVKYFMKSGGKPSAKKSGGTGKVELTPAAKSMAKMLRGGLGGSRVITSIKYNSKHDYKKSDLIAAYKSVYGENYKRVMKKHKV